MRTIQELRAELAEWEREKEKLDNERGYCVLDMPELPDPFCLELLERTESTLRPFLIRYAKLVYDTNEIIEVDNDNLQNIRDDLRIISNANEMRISSKAIYYIWAIDSIVEHKKRGLTALEIARRLTEILEETDKKAYLYDVPAGDYDYDYEKEYEKAKEALRCRMKLYQNYEHG